MSFYGLNQYEVGTRVKIASRQTLEDFQRTWKYHHPLQSEQLSFAEHIAVVQEVSMYHGGDILYILKDTPGTWHQRCLLAT